MLRRFSAGLLIIAAFIASDRAIASPKPIAKELIKANQTLGGRVVKYPEGTPEMRMYQITIPVGAKIPLHTHPSPVIVYVQQGTLTNVRIVDGVEVIDLIKEGKGFLEGSPEERLQELLDRRGQGHNPQATPIPLQDLDLSLIHI